MIMMIAIGSRCTQALINEPFVPHINLWEPCNFTKVPDGPQTYTLNLLVPEFYI
jgi:hypothetical protein